MSSPHAQPQTLFDKLWHRHVVDQADDGETLLYVDRHLVYEVTSPQAFEGLRLAGRRPWRASTVMAAAQMATVFRFSRTRRKPEKAASEAENLDMANS